MEQIALGAKLRTEFGKNASRKLRRAGRIPAILYGHRKEPLALSIDSHQLKKAMTAGVKESVLIDLNVEADVQEQNRIVMLKELQVHPVKRHYVHADFYEIVMDEQISMPISIHLVGKAKGVEAGGILRQFKREVEIRCLPTQIPDRIEIDVTDLEIGKTITLEEVKVEEGVEVMESLELPIVTVLPPTVLKKEEELEEAEEEAAEAGEEPTPEKPKEGEEG